MVSLLNKTPWWALSFFDSSDRLLSSESLTINISSIYIPPNHQPPPLSFFFFITSVSSERLRFFLYSGLFSSNREYRFSLFRIWRDQGGRRRRRGFRLHAVLGIVYVREINPTNTLLVSMEGEMVSKVKREKVVACMTCSLCDNLLRDATTISECLHTC